MTSVTVNKVRTYHITIYFFRLLVFHPNRDYEIPELHRSSFYFIIFISSLMRNFCTFYYYMQIKAVINQEFCYIMSEQNKQADQGNNRTRRQTKVTTEHAGSPR